MSDMGSRTTDEHLNEMVARLSELGRDSCPTVMRHLLNHVCGGNIFNLARLITVWAWKYQNPDNKLGCIMVFRGKPGAADWILQLHQRLCGPRLFKVANIKQITGRYIGRLQTMQWVVVDETLIPGAQSNIALLLYCAVHKVHEGNPNPNLVDIIMTADENWTAPQETRPFLVFNVDNDMGPMSAAVLDAEVPAFLNVLLHWSIQGA